MALCELRASLPPYTNHEDQQGVRELVVLGFSPLSPLIEQESTGPSRTLADQVFRSFDPGDSLSGAVERGGKLPALRIGDIGL